MANMFNTGRVEGRLTRDPELRDTKSGGKMCFVNVAVNRNYKNKETGNYDADFLAFTANGKTAEFIAQHFHKGDAIGLEYELYSYQVEEEGKKLTREGKRVTAAGFPTGGRAKKGENPNEATAAPAEDAKGDLEDDDDLPF